MKTRPPLPFLYCTSLHLIPLHFASFTSLIRLSGTADQAPCGVGFQVLVMRCAGDRVPVPSRNKGSHLLGSTRLMAVGRRAVPCYRGHLTGILQVQVATERIATDKNGIIHRNCCEWGPYVLDSIAANTYRSCQRHESVTLRLSVRWSQFFGFRFITCKSLKDQDK